MSDLGDQGTSVSEYGDVTDTCGGGGVASLNAPHREQMGYLPPSSINVHAGNYTDHSSQWSLKTDH